MAKESRLITKIRAAVIARGGRPVKYHGSCFAEAGIPDLLIAYRGLYVFIEAKVPGNKPSAIQTSVMQTFADCAFGGCAYSVQDALSYLSYVDRFMDQHFPGVKSLSNFLWDMKEAPCIEKAR